MLYGQLHKWYQRRQLVRIKYQMQCGARRTLRSALRALGWSGTLQTAFVERLNLTARMSVAALTRRTWVTAQTATGLQRQITWWRAYYHFIRPRLSLRHCGHACTPAMATSLRGGDIKAISEMAGHANVLITRNVYQHVNRAQRADALGRLVSRKRSIQRPI